tara:strand:- start:385 stop:747 length:363 start_codon:yes stop_codon:yes gene_type:complete
MSFIGAGLSLAPWKLATAESSIQTFRLPPASVHILHGNFATTEIEKLTIPEFDLECSVQVFMRNGIAPCDDDMTICTFQQGDETLHISYLKNSESMAEGGIKGLQLTLSSDLESFSIMQI